jgi:hypothetical protein
VAQSDGPLGDVPEIVALSANARPSINDYVAGASAYYRLATKLSPGTMKRSQIALSNALGRVLVRDLQARIPSVRATAAETAVAGALRIAKSDVTEFHRLDGLRLAVELKPVHLAVGRAIWNRFGDIRTFAVNIHLKFPFAVVGGVLTIPTLERREGRELTTDHLVRRAGVRLARTAGRQSEAGAPHLLEGVALVAYNPMTAAIWDEYPEQGSNMRWEGFVADLAANYRARFEGVEEAEAATD